VTASVPATTGSMITETGAAMDLQKSPTVWPQPVSESCPALVQTEELADILAHTEDEANRYCVRVCGKGSWCKCDADDGQPKVCQHGLLKQCGNNSPTKKRGTTAVSTAPTTMRVKYGGQVRFDVEDTIEVARLVELIRYNLSGLNTELVSATDGGEVEPAVLPAADFVAGIALHRDIVELTSDVEIHIRLTLVVLQSARVKRFSCTSRAARLVEFTTHGDRVPVMELLQSSNPIIENPDIVMNIAATIYLIVLPMWQPSVMEGSFILAIKTFFRTQIGEADVSVTQAVEIKVLVNNTTPRLMLEALIDQEAFLMAAGIALGPGTSVGHAMPSLIEYPDELGEYLPLPKNSQVEKSTLTILLACAVSASLIGLIVACCIVIRIIIQYRRSGASRDFELGKAGEVASSRADEETALDVTSGVTKSFFTESSDMIVSSGGDQLRTFHPDTRSGIPL
ncbi:hypothetical protein FOL47_006472, partial [Perkinsus chesapeaki]